MAHVIGISTKIKDAMNMIDTNEAYPSFIYHNRIYILSTKGRDLGSLHYTRFANASTPEYSVTIPYSFAHTVGYLIDKGDNLRTHVEPFITELPVDAYGLLYDQPLAEDILNPNTAPATLINNK